MKKNLLSLAMLAGLGICSANAADEFYLIKDGKIATGVEVLEYEDSAEGTLVKETTAPDGTAAVSIVPQVQYNDTRFYVSDDASIDLTKTWNIEIEFYYAQADLDTATHIASKWPVINMGVADDTIGGKYGLDNCPVELTFDVKFKNAADAWNIEKQFVYSPIGMQSVKLLTFGWQRQIEDMTTIGPVYIKNMKFVGEGNKPFFYENFNLGNAVYTETASNYGTYIVPFEGDAYYHEYTSVINITDRLTCNLPLYIGMYETAKEDYQYEANAKRLYENFGTDGSAYYDTELRQSLNIIKPSKPAKCKDGRAGRTFFLVPMSGLEDVTDFEISYLCKWDASRSEDENFTAETAEDSLVLPVMYAFVDTPEEANSCELNAAWNPGDLMSGQYSKYSYVAENASAGKKYMALVFNTPEFFSYVVDDVQIAAWSSNPGKKTSLKGAVAEAHPVGVTSYIMQAPGASENVIADADAVVYPNPATDVITVSNEGVENVEVVNTIGAIVAKANGNKVNVAALATGIYVVKAYTAEGVLTAKIVKK